MAIAKYTMFEGAQQHGYIVACMGDRLAKSREYYQIIVDPARGRVFQVFRASNPGVAHFEFVIPERETTESRMMWQDRAKKGLDKAWKQNLERLAGIKAARLAASGPATSAPSESPPSKIESLSTGAPPNPGSLSGPSGAVELETAVFAPEPLTQVSSPTEPTSSTASAPPSRKSASRSRSSSGGSKVSSG